jgi:hypothetical protein
MTPEALMVEQKKLEVSVWTRTIATQEHFNQLILQARNHLLTLVTAIAGAAALLLQKDISLSFCSLSLHVASLLFLAGLVVLFGFYLTEKGYHNLLVGAVKHAEALESQLEPSIKGIQLCQRITASSHSKIFFIPWNSTWRIRVFYLVIAGLFVTAFFVTARGLRSGESKATTGVVDGGGASATLAIPNDPAAGTKALKKFFQTGAYALILEEIISAAESYVELHMPSVDRRNSIAIFDIDDTALSTWEILLSGEFTWDSARFRNFVGAGKGKRIAPTQRLFSKIKSLGIPIIFLTSRSEDLREATLKNLRDEGFEGFAELVMKPVQSSVSTREFKSSARHRLRESGKVIFLCVGDQVDDLDDSTKGNFLLPNPFY